MAAPLLLPTPLSADSLTLGQLLTDPLNPSSSSSFLSSSKPTLQKPHTQSQYKDIISHDDAGHFISRMSDRPLSSPDTLLIIQASRMEYTSLHSPTLSFDALRHDPPTQTYLRNLAHRNQRLYYVVGLQKLKNPTFKRAVVKEGSLAEAKADPKLRLPTHVRRDSAMDLEESNTEAVLGLEVRKVMCHLGSPDEPHSPEDIGYEWSYHTLDGNHECQLSIGLGKALQAAELRAMAGIVSDEDFTDGSHDEDSEDSEGLAGF